MTSQQPSRFSKTAWDTPDCCRLALEADSDALASEFVPDVWTAHGAKQDKNRCKFFVIGASEEGSPDEPQSVLADLPYTREWIAGLPGRVCRAHFSVMEAGFALSVHTDGSSRFDLFDRTLRLHVPVVTNDACSMFVNGRFYRMRAGEVWQLNNLQKHSALNDHARLARTHLILDVEPDAELFRLLAEADRNAGVRDPRAYRRLHPRKPLATRLRKAFRRGVGRPKKSAGR